MKSPPGRPTRRACAALVVPLFAAGCSPDLDWREVRPADLGVQALFPCKPTRETRAVALAATPVSMTLLACPAGPATFGLATVTLADPGQRQAVLDALRAAQAGNLGAAPPAGDAVAVPGADLQPAARRGQVAGRLPGGSAARLQMLSFARGPRVYVATVLSPEGARVDAEAFFEAVRPAP